MERFMIAMASRNKAETNVPATPPIALMESSLSLNAVAVTAIAIEASTTIVECPREKKKPRWAACPPA